jgi:membrane protein implicated in regulation of membrane protease activity
MHLDAWVWWTVAACLLAAGEIATTGFFLAPFAAGAAIAAVLSVIGVSDLAAAIVFLASSVVMLTFVRPIVRRHLTMPAHMRTGTAALVGRDAMVLERIANDEGVGCAKIGGEVWTARAFDEDRVIEPGERVQVIEIRGATALVD